MQTYELLVKERSVRPNSNDMTLVRTSIGIDQIHVLFDNSEWLDFPITVTFAQGNDVITIPITVASISDSEWVAEATVTIPYEVIDMTGVIRVTFQGTSSDGRHIITAKGSPLSVEEAGDVVEGLSPSDAPTISEWQQTYADAQVLINQAQSLIGDLQNRIDDIVTNAEQSISQQTEYELPIATDEVLGGVKIGSGIEVTSDGTIFVTSQSGSGNQINQRLIERIAAIVNATISATFEDNAVSDSKVNSESIPVATHDAVGGVYPDGTSVIVDDDGMIHAVAGYVPRATVYDIGSVRPDGTTITIDDDGTIHSTYELVPATTASVGGVIVDGETVVVDSDGMIHVVSSIEMFTREEIMELTPIGDAIPDGDIISW